MWADTASFYTFCAKQATRKPGDYPQSDFDFPASPTGAQPSIEEHKPGRSLAIQAHMKPGSGCHAAVVIAR
jgi:hypothetical protein